MFREFIISGKSFGSAPVEWERIHGELYPPRSYALCCPACGEMWAKLPAEGGSWMFMSVRCEGCGNGSISLWDWVPESSWPEAVWRRELDLLLKATQTERIAA